VKTYCGTNWLDTVGGVSFYLRHFYGQITNPRECDMTNKIFNRQLFKKWWFWVAVVAILGLIGLLVPESPADTAANTTNNPPSQTVGTLPVLNKSDYTTKEGLVVYKDLATKGYAVTAKYVNEAVPATNQELTDQFKNANVNSCQDRLGFDAYIVADVIQNGDTISIILGNEPTSNQTCPVDTTNDL
jgi:hypothetical protein